MFRLIVMSLIGLAAAAVGPMLLCSAPGYWNHAREAWASHQGVASIPHGAATTSPSDESPSADPLAAAPKMELEGAPIRHLGEVLRFDVSPGWVMARWPRVSAGLARLQLQGYRVPLVTGTKATDLAGSLTYYFNAQQKVERITFHGTTGDARELVRLLTTRYRFARRLTNSPGLFVYETVQPDGVPGGVLRITSAQVVKASEPYQRFRVELVVERPR